MKSIIKRSIMIIAVLAAVLSCVSCGEKTPTPEEEGIVPYDQIPIPSGPDCDMDLTALSVQMKNQKVFEILVDHDKYSGMTVKLDGRFKVIKNNGNNYFCCEFMNLEDEYEQFLEFILGDGKQYPDDYPKVGEMITVLGTLRKYDGGIHIINAKLVNGGPGTTSSTGAAPDSDGTSRTE